MCHPLQKGEESYSGSIFSDATGGWVLFSLNGTKTEAFFIRTPNFRFRHFWSLGYWPSSPFLFLPRRSDPLSVSIHSLLFRRINVLRLHNGLGRRCQKNQLPETATVASCRQLDTDRFFLSLCANNEKGDIRNRPINSSSFEGETSSTTADEMTITAAERRHSRRNRKENTCRTRIARFSWKRRGDDGWMGTTVPDSRSLLRS